MSVYRITVTRRVAIVATAATSTLALAMATGLAPAASAKSTSASVPASSKTLVSHTILRGSDLGLTQPDDVTHIGRRLFVAFQNGVPSTGGTTGTPSQSAIVELTASGKVLKRWTLTGKIDGLTADPGHQRLIATVNEDGNSSLYTLGTGRSGAVTHYVYDANPLPHGGGTDSITLYKGKIFVAASAPSGGTFGPAMYEVVLSNGVARLAAAPFYDSSSALVANAGSEHPTVNLALTDPDSSSSVPLSSNRFGGQLMLDSQGDQQQIYVSRLGTDDQTLSVLNLSQSIDDTAYATSRTGLLVTTDGTDNTVVVISGKFSVGTAYTAVTPSNANTAPPNPGPNFLGTINLWTGAVSAAPLVGDTVQPKGLLFLSSGDGQE